VAVSVSQTKAGLLLTATVTTKGASIGKLLAEIEALKRRVQRLDGKHTMYVTRVTGDIAPATRSFIVDTAMVRRAITPAMYLSPPAFSPAIAGGKMLPNKATAITANFRKEMQDQLKNQGKKTILNRKQFVELYFENFTAFGSTGLGSILNDATERSLR
jgi:hypothetical protein